MATIRYADWINGQDFSKTRDRATNITAWSASTTYALDALVNDNAAYPNRKCYKSLQAGNLNHALTDAAWWVLVADGSAALPFQSITDATQGLTGGDECRVAKSPDDTALSGTLTFTEGSATLTGSGTAFTTELVIGDFVYGGDGIEYEIITITSNTAAVLFAKYPESTQSGVACIRVGMTETGAAAASTTEVQRIYSSDINISGGWNLATEMQTSRTNFKQRHGTFATRNGYGLYSLVGDLTIEKCNFFRYNMGIFISSGYNVFNSLICSSNKYGIYLSTGSYYNTFNSLNCSSNSSYGIYNSGSNYNIINDSICNSNGYGIYIGATSFLNIVNSQICKYNTTYGIYIVDSANNTINDPICNSNRNGIYFNTSIYNIVNNPICNSNEYGIYFNASSTLNTINSPTCNSNTTYPIFAKESACNYINRSTYTGAIYIFAGSSTTILDVPIFYSQWDNAKGDNRNYFYGGITKSNTANARSGKCLEYNPKLSFAYMSHSFFFKAVDATACTLSAYIQKNAAFNGDVQGAVYFLGLPVIDWTDITPTANDTYEKKSFSVTSGMVTDDSILELRIKVRGTAGAVYVDDLEQV